MFSKTADWIGEKKIVEFKVRGYCQWYNTLDLYFHLQYRPAGELESTSAEYQLLEQMNRVTCTKYTDMRQVTQNVSKGVSAQYYQWNEMILTALFKGVRPE